MSGSIWVAENGGDIGQLTTCGRRAVSKGQVHPVMMAGHHFFWGNWQASSPRTLCWAVLFAKTLPLHSLLGDTQECCPFFLLLWLFFLIVPPSFRYIYAFSCYYSNYIISVRANPYYGRVFSSTFLIKFSFP